MVICRPRISACGYRMLRVKGMRYVPTIRPPSRAMPRVTAREMAWMPPCFDASMSPLSTKGNTSLRLKHTEIKKQNYKSAEVHQTDLCLTEEREREDLPLESKVMLDFHRNYLQELKNVETQDSRLLARILNWSIFKNIYIVPTVPSTYCDRYKVRCS